MIWDDGAVDGGKEMMNALDWVSTPISVSLRGRTQRHQSSPSGTATSLIHYEHCHHHSCWCCHPVSLCHGPYLSITRLDLAPPLLKRTPVGTNALIRGTNAPIIIVRGNSFIMQIGWCSTPPLGSLDHAYLTWYKENRIGLDIIIWVTCVPYFEMWQMLSSNRRSILSNTSSTHHLILIITMFE